MKKRIPNKSLFNNVHWLVEPKYKWIDCYSDNLLLFCDEVKYGYINADGDVVIEPQFDMALKFSEGLAGVKINNKWGYINSDGKIKIEPKFDDYPGCFHEGLVRFMNYDNKVIIDENNVIYTGLKFGYADRDGKIIIQPQYSWADDFSEGLAPVGINDKYGYIDKTGILVIDPIFEETSPFLNSKARVFFDETWGIIENPLLPKFNNENKKDESA